VQVLQSPHEAASLPAAGAVTIGTYDGVHLGHRDLISRTRAEADGIGGPAVLVTFEPHPALTIRPESAPPLLTALDLKLELLEGTGIDSVLVVAFDETRSTESAEDFVRTVVVDALRARSVLVGEDFHFGQARRGDVALLRRMGADLGFSATGIPLHQEGGMPVTSTRIRKLITDGDVEEATTLLTRPHQVRGVVGGGDRRGRELGYPTANVAVPATVCLPADGVYAGWYRRPDGTAHPTAISLGRRPTFYDHEDTRLLEAHLLDFDGDLYGQAAAVEFVAHLRGQVRFDEIGALVEQMGRDVAAARTVLSA
jgi:riboflavin kinase/FMN adenylyltransferase